MFYLLDPEKWERQKHFEYYMQMIPCGYTVTVRLDVENLYQQVKKCGLKFYPAFIYCTGKVVNEKREFKMGVDQEGRPGYFDVMHPNFTIFHKDDHTFSDIWSYYDDDFQTCYQNIINDMETYKDVKGPKGKEGQPPNFFLYLLCAMDGFHRLQHMGANWKTKSISDHYIWKICGRRGQKKAVCCFDDISCIRRWISC